MIKNVLSLFPQTLIISQLDIDNDKLLSIVQETLKINDDGQFYVTSSCHLHEDIKYDFLVSQINSEVEKIFNEVYSFKNVKPYITLMWATCSKKDQKIYSHSHPNSLFSGVYYPQNINYSPIKFYDPLPKIFELDYDQANFFNSKSIVISPKQGQMFLFPSYLRHETDPNTLERYDRYSVAFNIFVKGTFGSHDPLSTLTLT